MFVMLLEEEGWDAAAAVAMIAVRPYPGCAGSIVEARVVVYEPR